MDEKQWLEKAIKAILFTESSRYEKLALIMQMVESYESMKEI